MLEKNTSPTMRGRFTIILLAAVSVLAMAAISACGESKSSQAEDNKSVVRNFIAEFKNNANHDIVDELMSADFAHNLKDPRLPPGRPAINVTVQENSSWGT